MMRNMEDYAILFVFFVYFFMPIYATAIVFKGIGQKRLTRSKLIVVLIGSVISFVVPSALTYLFISIISDVAGDVPDFLFIVSTLTLFFVLSAFLMKIIIYILLSFND